MRWFKRRLDRFEGQLDAEVRFHVERQITDYVGEGMSAEEARRRTLIEFGGVDLAKEECRDLQVWSSIEQLWQDLRYGARMLSKSPGFTAFAVISLALGIGANTGIFSMIDALMLRKLPVRNPQELVALRVDDGTAKDDVWYYVGRSYPDFQTLRHQTNVFSDISAIAMLDRSGVRMGGSDEADPSPVRVALVSGNYFGMMGVSATAGRVITPDDDRVPDGQAVAVISDAYWNRRFARARDIVGRTFALNGVTYTILGVTPRGFSGDWVGRPADIWIPIMMQSEVMLEMPGLLTRGNGWLRLVARLKPGVTLQQAQAAVQVVWRNIQREHAGPGATPERLRLAETDRLSLVSAASGYSSERATLGPSLSILMAIVGLVLLIACANVASLLLARSTARRKEMALRLALGASRARVVQQLLTEGVLLAALAGALGLLVSLWSTRALSSLSLGPVQMDSRAASAWVWFDFRADIRVLAFTATLCLLTAILFALAPALRGSDAPLAPALTGRGSDSESSFGFGRALVIAEVALSLVLLIGAGLFVRTLRNLKSVNLGLDRQRVLLAWTAPGQTGRTGLAIASLCRTIQQRVSLLPGVVSVSVSNGGLLMGAVGGVPSEYIKIPGQPPRPGQITAGTAVAPGYFTTVGLPLLAGRDFTELDTVGKPRVEIVNETYARFFFGNENPIGRRYGRPGDSGFPIEIVGVVKDTTYGSPRDKKRMWTYSPYLQGIGLLRNMQVAVRARGEAKGIAA